MIALPSIYLTGYGVDTNDCIASKLWGIVSMKLFFYLFFISRADRHTK